MHNSFRTSHYTDYKFLPIFNVLNADGVGNWPILQGMHWNRSEFSLERLFGQLFAHQVQSIFKLYVSPDETDPTKYLLEVSIHSCPIPLDLIYVAQVLESPDAILTLINGFDSFTKGSQEW